MMPDPTPPTALPGTPVNPFDPAATALAIYKSLAQAVAAIPAGHTHAILLDTRYTQADGPYGRLEILRKAPEGGWDLVLGGGYDRPHGLNAGVLLAKSW